jgi:hypothetical protein
VHRELGQSGRIIELEHEDRQLLAEVRYYHDPAALLRPKPYRR